jgi:hypothetical protein
MVVFEDIHRNVVSKIGDKFKGLNLEPFWLTDVTKAINQAIAKVREGYVKNKRGEVFSKTVQFYVSLPDLAYPYLHYTSIAEYGNILSSVDPGIAIMGSNVLVTDIELTENPVVYQKGTRVTKDGLLYEATESVPSINTFDLTYDPNNIRSWFANNGLKYKVGDVVRSLGSYYVCEQAHTNKEQPEDIGSVLIETLPAWTKVYWKLIGRNNITAVYFPFWQLTNLKFHTQPKDLCAFSIVRDKLYLPKEYSQFTMTYVPEWEYVSDLSTVLDLPYELVPEVETIAIQLLGPVLGFSLEQGEPNEQS